MNKAAEKQGFQFTVRKSKLTDQATVWRLSCTRHRIFEDKACKRKYVNNKAQFASGTKVTTVKENRLVEQRGPTGIKSNQTSFILIALAQRYFVCTKTNTVYISDQIGDDSSLMY
jgi:hypothetical protein